MKTPGKAVKQARLVLEDGSEYPGWSFGKARSQAGEVVFINAMMGYNHYLTDPCCRGQIMVSSYPIMGNTGIQVKPKTCEAFTDEFGIAMHFESDRIQVSGFVVSDLCEQPSHYSSGATLSAWFDKNNVPGIYGVDTRSLIKRIRENGIMQGKILVEGSRDVTLDSGIIANPVEEVSVTEVKTYTPSTGNEKPRIRIAVLDCGAKANIYRNLLRRNIEVVRLPWNHDLKDIEYDGLFLSTGPGDPKSCGKTIAAVRRAFDRGKPIFGLGLGSQIMALAAGADTYKLPFGHRGLGLPCFEVGASRCYMTSQNHGYAVRADSLPRGWEPWFVNANDNTIEGIRSKSGPFSSVQILPAGCPGPRDTDFLFDRFVEQINSQDSRGKKPRTL